MALFEWKGIRELIVRVTKLTANVVTLQQQVEKNTDQIAELQMQVRDLSANLRVAQAEMETAATRAAVQTVVQTYDGISRRVMEIEDGIKRLTQERGAGRDA